MTPIRLLAVDIDGTLLDSQWNLTETNRRTLTEAYHRGVQIVFVTGRRYHITHPITSTFQFPHFVITTAGAMTRSHSGKRIFAHMLDPLLARALLAHIRVLRPFTFLISDVNGREDLACESPLLENLHVARYVQLNTDHMERHADLNDAVSEHLIEIVLLGHVDEMRNARVLIDSFPRHLELKVLRTEYTTRDLCLLDVVAAQTDKGLAVQQLASHLKVPREAVMAIGDNHSDLAMLEYAHYPVVMGNATAELKSMGWPMTSSNDEDGVAQAINRYILNPM
jgi:Cof subfamily protein (haloacid dehalogenase superfamily)